MSAWYSCDPKISYWFSWGFPVKVPKIKWKLSMPEKCQTRDTVWVWVTYERYWVCLSRLGWLHTGRNYWWGPRYTQSKRRVINKLRISIISPSHLCVLLYSSVISRRPWPLSWQIMFLLLSIDQTNAHYLQVFFIGNKKYYNFLFSPPRSLNQQCSWRQPLWRWKTINNMDMGYAMLLGSLSENSPRPSYFSGVDLAENIISVTSKYSSGFTANS